MKKEVNKIAGFTLLEILIAMVIMSLALTLVIEICAGGLRTAWLSKDYTRAVYLAREKMKELILQENIPVGIESGEFEGGYTWRAEIKPYSLPSEQADQDQTLDLPLEPYVLTLELFLPSKEEGRSIKLNTLLLQRRDSNR
jgi:general secretion pathway protein I